MFQAVSPAVRHNIRHRVVILRTCDATSLAAPARLTGSGPKKKVVDHVHHVVTASRQYLEADESDRVSV